MTPEQAVEFARFLVEEKDEDHPEILTIMFDQNRQVNSQYIPVRLMTQFTALPAIYTDKDEAEAVSKFKAEFNAEQSRKFVKHLNQQEDAIISNEKFKAQVKQELKAGSKITQRNIDCAFIMLCRGAHTVTEHI